MEVNAAVVQGSIVPLPGEICRERSGQKSADAIVVEETSRGLEDARLNYETGVTHPTKGRTEKCPNRGTDAPADDASRRGMDESRCDGKHVGTQYGLARAESEPPSTDPYAGWCGTRGWR